MNALQSLNYPPRTAFQKYQKSCVQQQLLYKVFNWNNLQAHVEKAVLIGSAKLKCWAAIYISCPNSHMGQEPKKTGFPVASNGDGTSSFTSDIRYPRRVSLYLKRLYLWLRSDWQAPGKQHQTVPINFILRKWVTPFQDGLADDFIVNP